MTTRYLLLFPILFFGMESEGAAYVERAARPPALAAEDLYRSGSKSVGALAAENSMAPPAARSVRKQPPPQVKIVRPTALTAEPFDNLWGSHNPFSDSLFDDETKFAPVGGDLASSRTAFQVVQPEAKDPFVRHHSSMFSNRRNALSCLRLEGGPDKTVLM